MLRLLCCTKHSCGRETRQTIHIIGNLRVIQTFIQSIYIYVHAYIHPHTNTHTHCCTHNSLHTHTAHSTNNTNYNSNKSNYSPKHTCLQLVHRSHYRGYPSSQQQRHPTQHNVRRPESNCATASGGWGGGGGAAPDGPTSRLRHNGA